MKKENILIGFGEGVVTAGEVVEELFLPCRNGALIEKFLAFVRNGKIKNGQVKKAIQFLKKRARQYREFAQMLELELQATAKVL